ADHPLHLLGAGDVARDEQRRPGLVAVDRLDQLRALAWLDRRHRDASALAGEPQRPGPTQPRGATGNQRDLAREPTARHPRPPRTRARVSPPPPASASATPWARIRSALPAPPGAAPPRRGWRRAAPAT